MDTETTRIVPRVTANGFRRIFVIPGREYSGTFSAVLRPVPSCVIFRPSPTAARACPCRSIVAWRLPNFPPVARSAVRPTAENSANHSQGESVMGDCLGIRKNHGVTEESEYRISNKECRRKKDRPSSTSSFGILLFKKNLRALRASVVKFNAEQTTARRTRHLPPTAPRSATTDCTSPCGRIAMPSRF